MLAPFVAAAHGDTSFREDVKLRTDEEVHWAPDLTIEARKRMRGISVGERVRVGQGAGIRDAYALESLDVERQVVARTLTSDGAMHIGESVQILRWIDANGEITVGADSNLGVSASGGSRLTLGDRVEFERVWGSPVATRTAAAEPFEFAKRKNDHRKKSFESDKPQVDAGDIDDPCTARCESHATRTSPRTSKSMDRSRSSRACGLVETSSCAEM